MTMETIGKWLPNEVLWWFDGISWDLPSGNLTIRISISILHFRRMSGGLLVDAAGGATAQAKASLRSTVRNVRMVVPCGASMIS